MPTALRSPDPLARRWRHAAVAGAAVWGILASSVALDGPGGAHFLGATLLLAPLVVVPLGVSFTATPRRDGSHLASFRRALHWHPIGVAGAAASLVVTEGFVAGILASAWLVGTLSLALFGLRRLLERGLVCVEEVSLDAALLYLPVGAAWLVAARMGWSLGFEPLIVFLTAVHFHYAGFAAPVVSGLVGRFIGWDAGRTRRVYRAGAVSVALCPILLALGIAFSPLAEVVLGILLAVAVLLIAALLVLVVAPAVVSRTAQGLFALAGGAMVVTMFLAVLYALGEYLGRPMVSIERMVFLHGFANAFGFSLGGLLAWSLVRPPGRCAAPAPPFSRLRGRGLTVGADYFDRNGLDIKRHRPSRGLVDRLDEYRRDGFEPERVDATIRAFYERTGSMALHVHPTWQRGFRLAGRLFRRIARRVGQLNLPLRVLQEKEVASRILDIDESRDGRAGARAWVRTFRATGEAVYVAAYAVHHAHGIPYMNIAFPLPGGNLTSILRMDPLPGCPAGLVLTTLPDRRCAGDEGVYLVFRRGYVRLPVNETITVWPAGEVPGDFPRDLGPSAPGWAGARHELWVFGLRYLTLDCVFFPESREGRESEGS